jgi:hypothetical protein
METLFGQVQTVPSTEFVVIEHLASSPTANHTDAVTFPNPVLWRGFIQIRIGTTDYFVSPDGGSDDGVPSYAAPYPISDEFQPTFILYPDVYVLPGQAWDIVYKIGDIPLVQANADGTAVGDDGVYGPLYVFIKYTLYDGIDAIVANRLLELGITVKAENVDWFKRVVLSSETGVQEPTQRGQDVPGQPHMVW